MKYLYAIIMSSNIIAASAQSTYEYLDINNIRTGVNSIGGLFNDLSSSGNLGFEVPGGSGKHTIFSGNLWISGIDDGSYLRLAANTYRQSGTDFWAGPKADYYFTVIQAGVFDSTYDHTYNKVWKISKAEIDNHIANYNNSSYIMPWVIEHWPANGDTSLGQPHRAAPFADINNNTVYEPQIGEYPLMLGDQAILFINNDARNPHSNSGGPALEIDVYGMLYAYSDSLNPDLQNTVFVNYTIKNRSKYSNYRDVKVGMWIDFDLGCFLDDFGGSDSTLNSFFCYNGDSLDANCATYGYQSNLPAQGVTFLNTDMTGFISYHGDVTILGEPYNDEQFNNYLSGKLMNGQSIADACSPTLGSAPRTNFMYHDDPNDSLGISKYTCLFPTGNSDERSVGAAGGFSLPIGGKICVDLAFPVAFDSSAVNPHLKSVTKLKQRIQNIQNFYNQGAIGCPALALAVEERNNNTASFNIFPNPAQNEITISFQNETKNRTVEIISVDGKTIHQQQAANNTLQLETNQWQPGIYIVKVRDNAGTTFKKIMKL